MDDCKIRAPAGVARCRFTLAVFVLGVTILTASHAQTLTTLANFGGPSTNLAGFYPDAALIQGPDGTLYGTTFNGQFPAAGTVFKMQPDGSGFSVLKFFTNWLEGKFVFDHLTLSSNVLYGTADTGGDSDLGTIFRLGTDGSGFQVLKSFGTNDGANPNGGLVLFDNVLYGAAVNYPGASGAVFRMNTDGTDYTLLKVLAPSDGTAPVGGLTLSDGVLYGTTQARRRFRLRNRV
jgi:hypothetical protein